MAESRSVTGTRAATAQRVAVRPQWSATTPRTWAPTPPMPAGVIPAQAPLGGLEVERGAPLKSPIKDSPEVRKLGQQYYEYHCLMCHGPDGRGHTQVGGGYVPAPADLTAPRLDDLSDGELYIAMLSGRGHQDKNTGSDVLAKTVPEERRWPIVHYLKTF